MTIYIFSIDDLSTFHFIDSYTISFLSQFKNGRTRRAFQTYFIVLKSYERIAITQEVMCRIWEWSQCQNWFVKCRFGDFSLKNWQRSGSVEVDETHIKAIIVSDRLSTSSEIVEKFNLSHTCIQKKIKTACLCQETLFMDLSSASLSLISLNSLESTN